MFSILSSRCAVVRCVVRMGGSQSYWGKQGQPSRGGLAVKKACERRWSSTSTSTWFKDTQDDNKTPFVSSNEVSVEKKSDSTQNEFVEILEMADVASESGVKTKMSGGVQLQSMSVQSVNQNRQQMPIRAVHIARKMNLVQLFQRLYTDRYKVSHYLHKDSIVLRLRGNPKHPSAVTKASEAAESESSTDVRVHPDKYVVYFDYGAVVFFNCDEILTSKLIRHATKFCSDLFDLRGHEEELMLIADPRMEKWSELQDSCISVKSIDQVNVQVIAGILAQTVALEHYERQVDAILSEFENLNTAVEKTGANTSLFGRAEKDQQKKLFQIVATNNTLLIDLVSKLRVIDRKRPGDAAWKYTHYHDMWETLLAEFELSERFNNLNFKLELIQLNTKFFLEVLGSHKGERLEWYIIILISAELAISAYELAMKLG